MNATAPGPLLDWGRAPALDAFETLMWRMDRYPNLRSAVAGLVMPDRATDPERVRAAHEWGSRAVPRLRERLVDVPPGRPDRTARPAAWASTWTAPRSRNPRASCGACARVSTRSFT